MVGKIDFDKHPGLLAWAIKRKNYDLVQQFIDEGIDVNSDFEQLFDEPPEDIMSMLVLIECAFKLNPLFPILVLPLTHALRSGNDLKMIEMLISAGADPNRVCYDGRNAFQLAQYSEKHESDIIRLLNRGLTTAAARQIRIDGLTKKIHSPNCDQAKIIYELTLCFETLPIISEHNLKGFTILSCAISEKKQDIVDFLISKMSAKDINIRNFDNSNALCVAVSAGDLTNARQLVERGADIRTQWAHDVLLYALKQTASMEDYDTVKAFLVDSGLELTNDDLDELDLSWDSLGVTCSCRTP